MMRTNKNLRHAHGFSLLELMLVLVILAVLAGVVAYNVGAVAPKAKIRATITSMETIKNVLASYNLDYNSYPPSLVALQQQGTKSMLDPTKPIHDGWDRDFFYSAVPGDTNPYQLFSLGEDGQPGTADDINVWTMHLKKP